MAGRHTFISWSGTRGQTLAEELRAWLGGVVQVSRPWVSSVDIAKGQPWYDEIRGALTNVHAAIVILTPEAAESPFVLFESGWLQARVSTMPIVVGTTKSQVRPPLSFLQLTDADSDDMLKLVQDLNLQLADALEVEPTEPEIIRRLFHATWPTMERAIDDCVQAAPTPTREADRDPSEMLEEILVICRDLAKRPTAGLGSVHLGPSANDNRLVVKEPPTGSKHLFSRLASLVTDALDTAAEDPNALRSLAAAYDGYARTAEGSTKEVLAKTASDLRARADAIEGDRA